MYGVTIHDLHRCRCLSVAHIIVVIAVVTLSGCVRDTTLNAETPEAVLSKWEEDEHYTVYLPSDEDIGVFQSNLPDSLDVAEAAIKHDKKHIRRCGAKVIEELRDQARELAPDVRQAFLVERDRLVRTYLLMALASIGDDSVETVEFLRSAFAAEEDPLIRTYVAGALAGATDRNRDMDAWQWLLESLAPGEQEHTELPPEEHYEFWQRRWAASYMLGKMGAAAKPALQHMEQLVDDPHTPFDVKDRLLRDIALVSEANR